MQKLDYRKAFIHQFMRYWYEVHRQWPQDYETVEQFLTMFDDIRNAVDIHAQKLLEEHMATCVKPLWFKP